MKKIVVAVDGSEPAARAVHVAAQLAVQIDAELSIVAVKLITIDREMEKFARIEDLTTSELVEREAEQVLYAAKNAAARVGAERIETVQLWGDPAAEILECAKQASPEFLVLGKRGRGRLAGLLLGSVSQKVVALAQCPVVIVP